VQKLANTVAVMSPPLFSRLRNFEAYPLVLVLVLAVEGGCDGTAEPLFPADPAARRRFVPAMVRCQFLQLPRMGNWFAGSLVQWVTAGRLLKDNNNNVLLTRVVCMRDCSIPRDRVAGTNPAITGTFYPRVRRMSRLDR
jgi:hypothetical protein